MKIKDARSLSPKAQEALRMRAVKAVLDGMTRSEVAKLFGVSRKIVEKWVKKWQEGGSQALKAKKKGPKRKSRLEGYQAAIVVRTLSEKCPDQLCMPCALWTRESVGQFIKEKFSIEVSKWTVGRYLKRWGLSPQKPITRAYERDPKAVKKWLKEDYPIIEKRAKSEKARIFWGDETGIRSDHHRGRTWSKKGVTPVVETTGKRFSFNMISAISAQGRLYFKLFEESFTTDIFLDFIKRLVRQNEKKVFLIVDNHRVHHSRKVREWVAKNEKDFQLFFLPAYSPELNPDELVNQDVKTNAVGRKRVSKKDELLKNVGSFMRSKQRKPQKIRRYFHAKQVQYAAGSYW